MSFSWEDVDPAMRDSIEKGVIAIRKIDQRETFFDWLQVGESLKNMQLAAMRLAHSNTPKGRSYNDAYLAISKQVPDLLKINKTTRSHAVWMAEHKEAIEEWHARLPSNLQQAVNHPSTIKRRYEKEHEIPGMKREPKPGMRDSVIQLQKELDEARAEITRLKRAQGNISEGRDWSWSDKADDIAAVLYNLQPTKAVSVASKLMELHKSTTRKPRARKGGKVEDTTQELDLPSGC